MTPATKTLMQLKLDGDAAKAILDFIQDLSVNHDSRQAAALFLKTRIEKVYDVSLFKARCLTVT